MVGGMGKACEGGENWCSLVFDLYQFLRLRVYNLCDRQVNISMEQHENWSTQRKTWPITALYPKHYLGSNGGLRDIGESEIFVLKSVNRPKFSHNFPPKNVSNLRKWPQRVASSKSIFFFICCIRHIKSVRNISFHNYFWNWKGLKINIWRLKK